MYSKKDDSISAKTLRRAADNENRRAFDGNTHTLNGNLGSDVSVILNDTLELKWENQMQVR